MLAERVRAMYLLAIATPEVTAAKYQCSCGVKIMATIRPVRTAPLGNSQPPCILRRISTSIPPATITAANRPGTTSLKPSCGTARPSRTTRTMVSKPLGVWENCRTADLVVVTHPSSRMSFQRRSNDQPIDLQPIKQSNTLGRTQNESRRGERIRQHCVSRHNGYARHAIG